MFDGKQKMPTKGLSRIYEEFEKMNCPKCQTFNEVGNSFCITCGETLTSSPNLPPTLIGGSNSVQLPISNQPVNESRMPTQEFPAGSFQPGDSQPTVFGAHPINFPTQPVLGQSPINYQQPVPNFGQSQANFAQPQANFQASQANFNPAPANFQQSFPFIPQSAPKKSRIGLWLGLGGLFLLLISCGVVAAVLLIKKPIVQDEKLPDHLGMFFYNSDKTEVSEIKKQDFANAITGKDTVIKDESLPVLEAKPDFILYSDNKEIPVDDLKLVQLDSIKNDGSMKQIEFKATLVDGKPEMKKLLFNEKLANGKYAFALFDGYLNDGKHKIWAFQIKNSDRTDNGDLVKSVTVNVNSKSSSNNSAKTDDNSNTTVSTPTPVKVPPPVGATTAYCKSSNVVLRSGPSQTTAKIGSLSSGQKLYVMQYSSQYETFITRDGRELYSNYAYVQTESGKRGWVFAAYIK